MCLPDGWVTAVPGVGRVAQLRILGNGVIPPHAEAALTALHARAD
jgi:DNA (cytosine-5)-methyltransferase 1